MKEKKLNNFTNQMIKHMIKIKTVDLDELLLVSRSVEEHCVHVEAEGEPRWRVHKRECWHE